jgi:diguanylate cyclase (GGDEF)-like protein
MRWHRRAQAGRSLDIAGDTMITQSELQCTKLLIVDDRPVNVELLSTMLAGAGYTDVSSTMDPRQVCALHREHHYDLILLDLNMPYMNGFEVLAQLKAMQPEEYLPVLAVSAEPEHRLRALAQGAMDFITKPFDEVELLARIRNLLEARLLYTGSRDYGQRKACYDALTGLPNRLLFQQSLRQALAHGVRPQCALLLADLDGFARINDTLGMPAGDEVLRQFAQRLQRRVPSGGLVGRFGGDEFALLLSGLDGPDGAAQAAELVRQCCGAPFALAEGEVSLTASVGIALHPGEAADAGTLVQYASTALHQARQASGGSWRFFNDAMNVQARRRIDFENALREACEKGEFELYYQPMVELHTGRMVGAEALLRWNRPGHGQISPADFIPLLEETGLIVPVGAWVIDSACRQIGLWARGAAGPMPIAVNVASRQFADSALEAVVARAIAEHGIAPELLGLEVTESALMADIERTARTLAALRALGVKVAIDDFGTGYSSLAYLQRFPVDSLKIDIAFIRDVTTNPGDAALVDAVIAMAHSLDLAVVAEGVESEEQVAYLGRRRCDQIQGYYFSRPLPAGRFEGLLCEHAHLAASDVPSAPQPTLLIIDDDAQVLAALRRLLQQDGYHILIAHNAEQAFSQLALHAVHLILCDQRMDGMSGTELLDRAKDMYPNTFRIILSGYAGLDTVMEAINRGAVYRFYTKPWDNRVLRENIRSAFRDYWRMYGMAVAAA